MSSKAKFQEHRGQPFLVQATPGFLESIPDEDTPESLYEKHETILKEELSRMLARLPTKEADSLAKWLQGMTQAQIAEQEGVTQAAISIRAKRALEKLFAMRDRGELGTLKFIWDGLHKLQDHIDHEIDLERSADSDTSLPLGEEIGEYMNIPEQDPEDDVYIAAKQALVMHELSKPPAPKTTKPKRSVVRKSDDGFNAKEAAVLAAIKTANKQLHLKDIETAAKPMIAESIAVDYSEKSRNSWLRNSLRKLVRKELVKKLGKGMYAPCG